MIVLLHLARGSIGHSFLFEALWESRNNFIAVTVTWIFTGFLSYLLAYMYLFKSFFFPPAVLGLPCYVGFFSSFSEWGLLSSCGTWASHCGGISCCWSWALEHLGFSSCGSQALEHRLNSCVTRVSLLHTASGVFSDQGSNPRLLHWQVDDSLPLSRFPCTHLFKPSKILAINNCCALGTSSVIS